MKVNRNTIFFQGLGFFFKDFAMPANADPDDYAAHKWNGIRATNGGQLKGFVNFVFPARLQLLLCNVLICTIRRQYWYVLQFLHRCRHRFLWQSGWCAVLFLCRYIPVLGVQVFLLRLAFDLCIKMIENGYGYTSPDSRHCF